VSPSGAAFRGMMSGIAMATPHRSSVWRQRCAAAALAALAALPLGAQEPRVPAVAVREPLDAAPEHQQQINGVLDDMFPGVAIQALPGIGPRPAGLNLSFADAFEIYRGNRTAMQTARERECDGATAASCGADLPVRARQVLDYHDQLASHALGQLAEGIRLSAAAGRTTVVFVSSGLPFRVAPLGGLDAVRKALRESRGTLIVLDVNAEGRALAGLMRLVDAVRAERFVTTADDRLRLRARLAALLAREDGRRAQAAGSTAPAAGRPAPAFMKTATQHAIAFAAQSASLVADEHYVQEVRQRPSAGSISPGSSAGISVEKRVIESEVALIHIVDGELWLLARDVLRVDGRALPDADRVRLPSVHPASTPEALRVFERIAQQGSRFNIGVIPRTVNTPTLAMWLLTPAISPRFEFKRSGTETLDGDPCDVIEFRERTEPYLFVVADQPTPVSGRVWVERRRGAVVKTELFLPAESVDWNWSPSRARLIVTYRLDAALSAWVPRTMTERYDSPRVSQFIVTESTYTNFRQFTTSGRIIK
jgi:hypothetical protein